MSGGQAGRVNSQLQLTGGLEKGHRGAIVLANVSGAPLVRPHPRAAHEEAAPTAWSGHRLELPPNLSQALLAGLRCRRQPGTLREVLKVDRKSTRLNSSHLGISYAV